MEKLDYRLRLATIGTILLCGSVSVFAKPAIRESKAITQPDGTTVTIRLVGDEHAHLYLTEDGYPVKYDTRLGYVYAMIDDDGARVSTGITAHDAVYRKPGELDRLTPMDSNAIETLLSKNVARKFSVRKYENSNREQSVESKGYGLCETSFPSTGEQKGLVILVEYQDVRFDSRNSSSYKYTNYTSEENAAHTYWTDLLNKPGFDGFGSNGSCRDWFLANSADSEGNSQFMPEFDLFGPVTLPNNMAYYGGNNYYGDDERAYMMVVDACNLLDDEIDFSQYDRDGDGKVDNVYILYAGLGEADMGGEDTVWPHSWDLRYADADFMLDGVTIDHYACSNETDNVRKSPDSIGTFVHEFSHVLGLPDLYTTTYNNAYTPGAYSVLDYGPYNNEGRTPPNYSAYERWALGWMTPELYGQSGIYELTNLADTNKAYLVRTEKETEYFLLENRQQTGWDAYLPGHGMLIWHIDYVPSIFENNVVNNTPSHQYVDLIEANGKKQERYAAGHPFPGTSNVTSYTFVSWSKQDCGVSLSDLSEKDGVISKYVENLNPSSVSSIGDENIDGKAEYYNLQGMRIAQPVKGETTIVRTGTTTRKVIF